MPTAFENEMRANFYGEMLKHFPEPVTIQVDGAADRIVWGVVRRTTAQLQNGIAEVVEMQTDRITFKCGRDEAHELGGIDFPAKPLRLIRASEKDPTLEPYAWTGEVLEENPHSWLLEFERPRLTRLGKR